MIELGNGLEIDGCMVLQKLGTRKTTQNFLSFFHFLLHFKRKKFEEVKKLGQMFWQLSRGNKCSQQSWLWIQINWGNWYWQQRRDWQSFLSNMGSNVIFKPFFFLFLKKQEPFFSFFNKARAFFFLLFSSFLIF